jgi:chromosome segregation ATPase
MSGMTPDEIERTMEFLLAHQARAEVRHEQIQTQLAGLVEQQRELVEQQKTLSREMDSRDRKLSARIEKLTDGFQVLKDVTRDLVDHARWTDARLRRLENPQG